VEKQVRELNLKEWVKPFDNEQKPLLRKIGNIEFGFIESKDDHCYVHKMDYINELHKLPSGEKWYGCPKCKEDINKLARIQEAKEDHKKRMARLNQPEEIYQQPKIKTRGF
jgi:hypothetical protein